MQPYLCLGLCPWAGNDDKSTQVSSMLVECSKHQVHLGGEDVSLGVTSTSLAQSLAEASRWRRSRPPGEGRQCSKWSAEATLESNYPKFTF